MAGMKTHWLNLLFYCRSRLAKRLYRPIAVVLLLAAYVVASSQAVSAEDKVQQAKQAQQGAVYFKSRYYMGGNFADGNDASGISWKNDSFAEPFIFDTKTITEISFRQQANEAGDQGELGIELTNGDILFGTPVEVSDGQLRLASELLGNVSFNTSLIRRIFRWSGGQSQLYSGPGPVAEWRTSDDAAWRSEGGQIATSKALAKLYQDVGLTARCRIEIEVAWEQKPNFVIALGTDGTPQSTSQAYRVEFWGSAIVILREMGRSAKVSSLGTAEKTEGRLKLAIELDQIRQMATVYSERGERLGAINFESEDGKVLPGIAFENIQGDLRINSINILQGAGGDSGSETLVGSQLTGVKEGQLLFSGNDGENIEVAIEDLTAIRLEAFETSEEAAEDKSSSEPSGAEETEPVFHVTTQGSTQLTGALDRIAEQRMFIKTSYFDEPVGVPLSDLRSFRANQNSEAAVAQEGRQGILEMEDVRMLGNLLEATGDQNVSCLRFRPVYALNSAQLLTSANGKMVYRERELTPEQRNERRTGQPVRRARGGFLGAVVGALAGNEDTGSSLKRHIHLRSGDAVEARVLSINDQGVLIDSLVTGEKVIPHDAIKAVELKGLERLPDLETDKKTRLLTVPRLRKNSPPTHLLISADGDFLKGNLISLDDENAVVENRLESMSIPRKMITTIIWFHEDELDGSSKDKGSKAKKDEPTEDQEASEQVEQASETADGLRVQAIHANGVRLTFTSNQFGGDELVGESPILGACLVNIRTVDQLLFGSYIDSSNEDLPFQQWQLTHAPDPKVLAEGGGDGMQNSGISSPLVGNPAPDFQLDLLEGGRFRVSDQKGKILVLDFWATWCGPCMNAMPMIDEAVHGFEGQDVQLIAVNLQEAPEQIQATLKRLGLNPSVALDIDGVAAARYQANAIPQTVVIDREGIVRRVFVGGGNGLGASLTEAIKAALEGRAEADADAASE